jgi:hypothetical protein
VKQQDHRRPRLAAAPTTKATGPQPLDCTKNVSTPLRHRFMVPHQSHNATCLVHRPCHGRYSRHHPSTTESNSKLSIGTTHSSQVQALQDLTSLLTGIIKQDNHDAPSLRVDAPATLNETTTTAKQSSSMKTSVDNLAPALRVEVKEPLTEPTVPPRQVQADDSTATGIANDSIKQKQSKAIDMHFYWIRDHVRQGQFHIFWKRGIHNRADYFTKHHPAAHHQDIRSSYLYEPADRSKNYFECLQEQDSEMTKTPSCKITGNSPKSESKKIPDQGEGVLISNIRVPPNIVRDPNLSYPSHS